MTFLKKIINFIKKAYLSDHFPSFIQVFFSKKKKLIYYGFLGDGNFGDELVFEATRTLFNDCLIIPYQRYMPIVTKIYCNLFSDSMSGIIIGGGTLLRSFNADKKYYQKLVNNGKPVFFHGTGTDENLLNKEFWQTFIPENKYGGVRGPLAIEFLKKNNLNFQEIGDAALFLSQNSNVIKKNKTIIVNFGTHKLDNELVNSRNEIIKFLKSDNLKNYNIIYLPFHSIDLELGDILKSEIKEIEVLDIASSYKKTLKLISEAEFCVGERLHFNVICALANTNFISINYDKKHIDFLKSINLEYCGYSPKEINLDLIETIFKNTYESIDWMEVNNKIDKFRVLHKIEKTNYLKK